MRMVIFKGESHNFKFLFLAMANRMKVYTHMGTATTNKAMHAGICNTFSFQNKRLEQSARCTCKKDILALRLFEDN
jgi:hypothetical protein